MELVTVTHLNDEKVSDEIREHQRQRCLEFAQLARDYAAREAARCPPSA